MQNVTYILHVFHYSIFKIIESFLCILAKPIQAMTHLDILNFMIYEYDLWLLWLLWLLYDLYACNRNRNRNLYIIYVIWVRARLQFQMQIGVGGRSHAREQGATDQQQRERGKGSERDIEWESWEAERERDVQCSEEHTILLSWIWIESHWSHLINNKFWLIISDLLTLFTLLSFLILCYGFNLTFGFFIGINHCIIGVHSFRNDGENGDGELVNGDWRLFQTNMEWQLVVGQRAGALQGTK